MGVISFTDGIKLSRIGLRGAMVKSRQKGKKRDEQEGASLQISKKRKGGRKILKNQQKWHMCCFTAPFF